MGTNPKSLLPVDTVSTGSVNAYEVYIDEAEGYYEGQKLFFKSNLANTGAATLSVNGRTAKAIKKANDQALVANDIELGQYVGVIFNATDDVFEMFTPTATAMTTPTAASISNTPAGNIAATTVQAAIDELDTEKASVSMGINTYGTYTTSTTTAYALTINGSTYLVPLMSEAI